MFCQSQALKKKKQILSGFFDFQKNQNFKIWLQKRQIDNPGLDQLTRYGADHVHLH